MKEIQAMKASELKKKYLDFFEKKGHAVIPSASLVPENDPTSLFTSAGMQPLVPYLMGEKHPEGNKLANIQRCVRTGDIDEVGDESHLTYFEMMGYWSLGAYWKKEAIEYIYDFLTKELKIDSENFAVTCFAGDPKNNIPKDTESANVWRSLGIPESRIAYLGHKDNFWGPVGDNGPCGPDTELFVWVGEGETPENFDPKSSDWMELCNDVFMGYYAEPNEKGRGKILKGLSLDIRSDFNIKESKQKNVDFGMGFERLLAYLEGESDIYKTEVYKPIIDKLEELSGKKYKENQKAFRIIADHMRSACNIIRNGVIPGKSDQGSVLRNLIRKCMEQFSAELSLQIGEISGSLLELSSIIMKNESELTESSKVNNIIADEVGKALRHYYKIQPAINKRLKVIERLLNNALDTHDEKIISDAYARIDENPSVIMGKIAYRLWNTYRFPKDDMLIRIKEKHGEKVDIGKFEEGYKEGKKQFSEVSRAGVNKKFKGGLADAGEETKKLHTAAHLMLEALRRVLGDHVEQRGSNITAERLRFDFSHPKKLTDEEKKKVENVVNQQIEKDLPVTVEEMTVEEAEKAGATGVFKDRYGEKVKVYSIGDFSKEICGGPHVEKTGELGHFKIKKEQSSSAGIRRIKAVLE